MAVTRPSQSHGIAKHGTRSTLLHTQRLGKKCKAIAHKTGKQCGQWAPMGSEVCRYHGGATKAAIAKANKRVEQMEAEYLIAREMKKLEKKLGQKIDTHPLEAMLEQVQEAAANVEVLRMYIEGLDIRVTTDHATKGGIAIAEIRTSKYHIPARVHVMVELYNEERDRLVRYSKLCLDAGVDERRVRVAEQQAQRMAQAFAAALDDVPDLTVKQRDKLRQSLANRLRAMASRTEVITV